MRQSQKNNRARSRGRKPSNPLSRSYDSNGPDVKIRGTASHIAEKYQSLARDAQASGDIVLAENYYQHAEHYLRIIASAQAANRDFDRNAANGNGDQPAAKPSRRGQNQPVAADAADEKPSDNEAESAPSENGSAAAFDASDPSAEQPVVDAPVNEEVEVPAPAKPRRRRTSYRSRKKPATGEAAAGTTDVAATAPVSLADAPQPVVADE